MLKALVVFGAVSFAALLPDVARADEEPLVNPSKPSEVWGKKITGLGALGDEVALVFTNTAVSMDWPVPVGVTSFRYLVVGGGGGGGGGHGGGGGAGGFFESEKSISDESSFVIAVGSGGAGGANDSYYSSGADGAPSRLSDVIVLGGGGGGSYKEPGHDGASGGGGSCDSAGKDFGKGTVGQGFDGGYATVSDKGAGGGGGCGGLGGNATSTKSGDGGIGKTNDITGVACTYAGGGGGFGTSDWTHGLGQFGGGNGGAGVDGEPATTPGSGGGGATKGKVGGRGADGVVVIRYTELRISGCTIEPDRTVVETTNLKVNLTLGAREVDMQIWVAVAPTDRGENIAKWSKKAYCGFAGQGAGAKTMACTIPDDLAKSCPRAIRFFSLAGSQGGEPLSGSLSASPLITVSGEWPYEPEPSADHWTLAKGMSESADVTTTMSDGVWILKVVIPRGSTVVNVIGATDCSLPSVGELDLAKEVRYGTQIYGIRGLSLDGSDQLPNAGDLFSDHLNALKLPATGLVSIECVRNFEYLQSISPFIPESVQFLGGDGDVFCGNSSLVGDLSVAGVRCFGVKGAGELALLNGTLVSSVTFGSSLPFCPGAKFDQTSAEGFSEATADPTLSLSAGFLSGAAELRTVVFPKALDGRVGDSAFDGCTQLSSIGFATGGGTPVFDLSRCFGNVTSLGGGVFAGCANLRGELVLSNLGWVTNTARQAYCPALGHSALDKGMSIGAQSGIGSVTVRMADCPFPLDDKIADYGFHGGTDTSTYGVFKDMTGLTNLVIEARQFTKISGTLCSGCTNLTDVHFSAPAIVKVEHRAFYGCSSLRTIRTAAAAEYDIDLPCVTEIAALAFGGGKLEARPLSRTIRLGAYETPLVVTGKPSVNNSRVSGLFCDFPNLTEALVSGSDIAFAGGEFYACASLATVTIRAKTVSSLGLGGNFAKCRALQKVQWQSAPPPSLSLDVPLFDGIDAKSVVNSVIRTFGWTDASRVNISWDQNGRTGVWRTEPDQLVQGWNPYGGGFVITGR